MHNIYGSNNPCSLITMDLKQKYTKMNTSFRIQNLVLDITSFLLSNAIPSLNEDMCNYFIETLWLLFSFILFFIYSCICALFHLIIGKLVPFQYCFVQLCMHLGKNYILLIPEICQYSGKSPLTNLPVTKIGH